MSNSPAPDFNPMELDRIIHERTRLGIMSVLVVRKESASFQELKQLLELTDGNLNAHIRQLEQAGYIGVHKKFVGRKPHTYFTITDEGRKEFEKYLNELGTLLDALRPPQSESTKESEEKN